MIYFNGIKGKNYFEGWFFRVYAEGFNCALIPSVSVTGGEKKAFIQFQCNGTCGIQEFDFSEFSATDNEVVIGKNRFSDKGIHFSGSAISLDVEFGKFTELKNDIMGCFKFGTPCKHKIISMAHSANGKGIVSGEVIELRNASAYIEKDWGNSFPKSYCWLQSNNFDSETASFFFSVAKIGFPFLGFICALIVGGKEYRFATYNFSFIKKLEYGNIVLKKSDLTLFIKFSEVVSNPLLAPKRGKMNTTIKECLNGTIHLTLKQDDNILFDAEGKNAGVEWYNF